MEQLISDEERKVLEATEKVLNRWHTKLSFAVSAAPNDSVKQDAERTLGVVRQAYHALDEALGYLLEAEFSYHMHTNCKTADVFYGGIKQPGLIAELGASTVLGTEQEQGVNDD